MKFKIKATTNLKDLIDVYPQVSDVLLNEYGLHCVGCLMAGFETLEEGAKAHGYDDDDVKQIVKNLNQLIK